MNVTFKTNGTMTRLIEDENEEMVEDTITPNQCVIPFFSECITFEDGFKLRHLFDIMIRHPELQLINSYIEDYLEIYKNQKSEMLKEKDSEFSCIVVCPAINISFSDYDIELSDSFRKRNDKDDTTYDEQGNKKVKVYSSESMFKHIPRNETKINGDTELHTHLVKYITDEESEQQPYQGYKYDRHVGSKYITYSMTFIDIMAIADLPITVSGGVLTIDKHNKDDKEEKYEVYDSTECDVDIDGIATMNMFNIVDSIVTDICFHGGPEESQKFLDKIVEMKNQIDTYGTEIVDPNEDNNEEE
ncbi:hypothetical protein PBI_SCTP2_274 [Salicola phage SCTP-2]|nr:hypothetical protein PBI_SCTP2_274 [Salicola phage SCTP-2]